jgi:hypothetical protein
MQQNKDQDRIGFKLSARSATPFRIPPSYLAGIVSTHRAAAPNSIAIGDPFTPCEATAPVSSQVPSVPALRLSVA